jgi:hypothetical protein
MCSILNPSLSSSLTPFAPVTNSQHVMDRLPAGIAHLICCQLCAHCQCPAAFPNADTDDVIVSKASLGRLACTCKSMCAIAQPVVFHYFATWNLALTSLTPESAYYCFNINRGVRPEDKRSNYLGAFLRSIVQRPDLARFVEALQLVACSDTLGILSLVSLNQGPDADGLMHAVMHKARAHFTPKACEMLGAYCMLKPGDD